MGPKGRLSLSVVVCTYNRAQLLNSCLESLIDQTFERGHYEVIVVDNNSDDNTQEVVRALEKRASNFRLVEEREQGLSAARNRGWTEAAGMYVAFIDDDAKAGPEWCERVWKAFVGRQPTPGAVGGKIHPWYEAEKPNWFSDLLETRSWGERARFLDGPEKQFGFSGSNMAFPREVLEQNGGFATEYGMAGTKLKMGEETELFMRLSRRNQRFWYDPNIKVYHYVPRRNTTMRYRFTRSFKSGEAVGRMRRRNEGKRCGVRDLTGFGIVVAQAPVRLIRQRDMYRTELLRIVEELGSKVGYMSGLLTRQARK